MTMAMGSAIRSGWCGLRSFARVLGRRLESFRWSDWLAWVLIGVAIVVLLPTAMALLLAAIVVAMAFFWVGEFVRLMRTSASAFPGRHDRLVWIAVMILLLPVGALAFWTYRRTQWDDDTSHTPSAEKPPSPWSDADLL
jgi:hypothetical protein